MSIENPKHVTEGRVRITLKTGYRFAGTILRNDPAAETFHLEVGAGFFARVGYEDFASATRNLNQ